MLIGFFIILNALRFTENLTPLFFLLSRHKFSCIALVTVVNFNVEKRKKKKLKIRKAKCIEYSIIIWALPQASGFPLYLFKTS